MKTRFPFCRFRSFSVVFLAVVAAFAQPAPAAAPMPAASLAAALLVDDFTSPGKWRASSGDISQTRARNGVIQVGNGVLEASLAKPANTFTLKVKLRHTDWQRSLVVWITDASGGQGYGLIWDSSVEEQFNGEGLVVLHRLNKDGPPLFGTRGAVVGDVAPSGHPVQSDGLAEITLKRFSNGSLFVEVDGRPVLSVTDSTWGSFENVYLSGNGNSVFGSISVTEGVAP